MEEKKILKAYELAKERYAAIGVDTDKAVEQLEKQQISLHCWQTDDVMGFESAAGLSGGIQTTGNYPGRARNIDEVRADLEFVKTLLAGNHRVLSLANPDPAIREFWIEHTKRCRRIADAMGKAQDDPCIMNIWVHDGQKDYTVNRKKYREILAASLDEILKEDLPGMKSCVEAKLFGIGLESYTVGSMDFFEGYCASRKVIYTLDTGHYEPTENVADKVSSLLLYVPELMLHVSRPVRWDSDHVTIMNDMTLDFFKELVRSEALHRAHVGLDYFDASINRIGAYIIGTRATQKCILSALLEPLAKLREYEAEGKGFQKLALLEEAKTLPFGAVFDYFNFKNDVPVGEEFIPCIEKYEKEVTSKR